MTTQRRAALHADDEEEDDEGDGDDGAMAISGWGTSDFDATIFAHADAAAVADRRFPPKPKPAAAVVPAAPAAAHHSSHEQQHHDNRKNKKTLCEADCGAKSPRWNRECEDGPWRSTGSRLKIPKAQLVTTQLPTAKTSPVHNYNNNHPSSHHHHHNSNNNSNSKTALVSREFAVSGYTVPTELLQHKELSPIRRRDRHLLPRDPQLQQTESKQPAPGSVCKIGGLIDDDDDDDMELADLWRLPPAVRRSEAFRQHQQHKHREKAFLLPPLLHGSNSLDSLLSPLFRSDLEQKMKALPVPFGSHSIGQSPAVVDTNAPSLNNSSSGTSEQLQQQQEHYSSMRRSHRERQSRQHNNSHNSHQHQQQVPVSKYKQQEALHDTQVRCVAT